MNTCNERIDQRKNGSEKESMNLFISYSYHIHVEYISCDIHMICIQTQRVDNLWDPENEMIAYTRMKQSITIMESKENGKKE
jgi:hypothetical protein